MSTTPYQFIKRGNLFITPVGPSISEAPYPTQSFTKPREFSLWVRGKVEEPEFQLDQARMPPSMYQEVRKDLSKYSSVPVSRSAFRRSQHAYVGVIDSRGKPYYFALDSRGFSCREAPVNDDRVWKTFDQLAGEEQLMAIKQRRQRADEEMVQVDRELSEPLLIIMKSEAPPPRGESTVTRKPKLRERVAAALKRNGGFDTHKEDGTPIKKPSAYQRLRSLVGKPRTDITDTGDDAPKMPKMKLLSKAGRHKGDVIPGGLADKKTPSDFDPKKLAAGIKVEMEHTSSRTIAREIAMDHLTEDPRYYEKLKTIEKDCSKTSAPGGCGCHACEVKKALPKKSKEEPVKKPKPASGASKKQMGAGGKTRYTYLQEGKAKLPKPTPLVVALPQETRQNVDPTELANQLGVSKLTLTKIASKLGRKGFSRYMRSHLKRFAAKHRLGHDYWDQIYGTVVQTSVQNEEKTFGSP